MNCNKSKELIPIIRLKTPISYYGGKLTTQTEK